MRVDYRKLHREAVKDFLYIRKKYGSMDTGDMYEQLEELALQKPTYRQAVITVMAMISHTFHNGYSVMDVNHWNEMLYLPVDDDPELQRIKARWFD